MMPAIDYLEMTTRIEFKLGKNLKSKSLILNTYASQRIKINVSVIHEYIISIYFVVRS